MKYSFIVIAYNEQMNIAACLTSIEQQEKLGSSYEIIAVNDGSRDQTGSILERLAENNPHIQLLGDGENHGRGHGRAIAVEVTKGELIAMIDADIILPRDWLSICKQNLDGHDLVGGTAVPDGDVAYIYRLFNLTPKVVAHSATVSGGNGCYRRKVFAQLNFNPSLREGEDVELNHLMEDIGLSAYCIPGLTVQHRESKSFGQSLSWLFQSGIGATRQLFQFRELRMPDIAFFIFLALLILAILTSIIFHTLLPQLAAIVFVIASSVVHIRSKFSFRADTLSFVRYPGAIMVNSLLLASYYAGRLYGLVRLSRSSKGAAREAIS